MLKIKITLMVLTTLNLNVVHSGDVFEITKSTINASGNMTSGNQYEIKSSVGQAEAASFTSGGIYAINGGIWSATINNNDIIFKNGFEN